MKSFKTKLLLVLAIAITCTTVVLGYFSITSMKSIVNRELERSYSTQLKTIIANLEKKHEHLKASGLEGLYKEGYKEEYKEKCKEKHKEHI